ncbi:hypothetical protein LINPERHAP1_LOCUS16604 [Linum perenne]
MWPSLKTRSETFRSFLLPGL